MKSKTAKPVLEMFAMFGNGRGDVTDYSETDVVLTGLGEVLLYEFGRTFKTSAKSLCK